MSKIWLEGFWKPHPEKNQKQVVVPLPIYVVMFMMTSLILVMGLAPDFVIAFFQSQQNSFYGEF